MRTEKLGSQENYLEWEGSKFHTIPNGEFFKVSQKIKGKEKPIDPTNDAFNQALIHGKEITAQEYTA